MFSKIISSNLKRHYSSMLVQHEATCLRRLQKQITPQKIKDYQRDGYAVFHEIYDVKTINEVKSRMAEIVDKADTNSKIATFSTENNNRQERDDYFLDSAWQIKPFFEVDAIDKNGQLLVPKSQAFNKVGHNMHDLDPVFEKFSYSKVMKTLLFQVMEFKTPLVVQSMYIFKNPRVGGVVEPHKDASYLISEPSSCQGIWVGLDDSSKENGCLWGIPGSHQEPPKHYLKVKENNDTGVRTTFMDPPNPSFEYKTEGAVPLEVEAGSIVLIHGRFTHFSEKNSSDKQRHAYTLHIVEGGNNVEYSPYNWIQRPKDLPFRQLKNDL